MTGGVAGPDPASRFEPYRRYLLGLAYRMLGSLAEAEDAVQDAYLRWHDASARATIDDARAYLARTVTRLCLDRLKSARARRETYVGPWLPEPVLDDAGLFVEDPSNEYASDLSIALLLTLERLSPLERAAFLLHDVFYMPFAEIAATLGRSEAACRQLAGRARAHVRAGRPRFDASEEEQNRLVLAFAAAVQSGEVDGIARLLAEDAVFYSDGGGKVPAALNPVSGAGKVARLVVGLATKFGLPPGASGRLARINGLPGFVFTGSDGPIQTVAFEIGRDRLVSAIYAVRNPDKLRHLH